MNTPKSQNPEGKVVAHRWLRNGEVTGMWASGLPSERQLEAQRHCSNIEGVTWAVEYAYSEDALADMQRRLEAALELADEWSRQSAASRDRASRNGDFIDATIDRGLADLGDTYANELRTTLLRDGKGEGVS